MKKIRKFRACGPRHKKASKRPFSHRIASAANVWQWYIRQYNTLPKYQPPLKPLWLNGLFEAYSKAFYRTLLNFQYCFT